MRHKHEWRLYDDGSGAFCTQMKPHICGVQLSAEQAEHCLNATEELSTERANRIAYQLEKGKSAEALRAYAEELEAQ